MFLGQYQDLIQLIDRLERADQEFGQDLWLMAERIVLGRLTRSQDKQADLNSIFHVIEQISRPDSSFEDVTPGEKEISSTIAVNGAAEDQSDLASSFSAAVDMLEKMDSAQLYKLITWLRNEKAFDFQKSLVKYYQSRQPS